MLDKNTQIYIKDGIIIALSSVIGSLMSIYINNKYGSNILANLLDGPILDIMSQSMKLVAIFGIITIILLGLVMVIYWLLKLYIEPLQYIWHTLRIKLKFLGKIKENRIDVDKLVFKNPFLIKIVAMIIMFSILSVGILGRFTTFASILRVYTALSLIYFIIRASQK